MAGVLGTFIPDAIDVRRALMLHERAPVALNARQAAALNDLCEHGKLRGTTLPDVKPPLTVALIPLRDRALLEGLARIDGPGGEVTRDPDLPPANGVLVIGEDGRMWQIPIGGLCWPSPMPDE